MSLTTEDLNRIRDLIHSSEERVYRRIKDNALSGIHEKLDGVDGRLEGIDGRLDGLAGTMKSMAVDVAKIPQIEGEVREINENVAALRQHAGI